MNPLNDYRLRDALRKYVKAHGGDPDTATAEVVEAEYELEGQLERLIGRKEERSQGTLGGIS